MDESKIIIERTNPSEYIDWNNFNIVNNDNANVLINAETINEDIQGDIDKLSKLKNMPNLKNIKISSSDFRVAKYFSTLLKEMDCKKSFDLLDDFENKDRSYIDFTDLGYDENSIPYQYIQWGVSKDKYKLLNGSISKEGKNRDGISMAIFDAADSHMPTNEDLSLINEFIENAKQIPDLNQIDKVVLATNYLQSKVQYVTGKNTWVLEEKYTTENFDGNYHIPSSISSVLSKNVGMCNSISRALVLLLNNPEMNVNCRVVNGKGHAYCAVYLDDKAYAVDPTWLTTRNKNKLPETLKATQFSDDYLLVGQDVVGESEYHTPRSELLRPFEKEKLEREIIFESVNKLERYGVEFKYNSLAPLESKKEKKDQDKTNNDMELADRT